MTDNVWSCFVGLFLVMLILRIIRYWRCYYYCTPVVLLNLLFLDILFNFKIVFMKRKIVSMKFSGSDDKMIERLSKSPCGMDQIVAALQFAEVGDEIILSIEEVDVNQVSASAPLSV